MDFRLKPKEEKFFSMLNDHAKKCQEAGDIMAKALSGDYDKHDALKAITKLEHEADDIVASTGDNLMKTFITPMDREDIQALVEQLDDTIDDIKEIMDKLCIYQVGDPTEGTKALAKIVDKSLIHIAKSISYMGSLKKNHVKVEARAIKVRDLESKADRIYHDEMAKLFSECKDPIEIIKWKEILDSMEAVIDGCEKLVGTFRRVVLKYA